MVEITRPKPGEHVNANGVWDLSQNKGKMTIFSLCLLLCADLLDLAVGKSEPLSFDFSDILTQVQQHTTSFIIEGIGVTVKTLTGH